MDMTTLRQLGEREVIRRLTGLLSSRPDVRVHIGDDVAVVSGGADVDFLLTSDAVIEGTHFLPDTVPEQIGNKAIGRALSDLAATGGEPLWALIDVVAPPNYDMARLEGVYRGLERLASQHGLAVVGGDLAKGSGFELHVFAVGRVPAGQAVLRSGARPGDLIYVTGALGGSIHGKHLAFEPRVREGNWLRQGRWATSMIDISDGLATDLRHILEMSNAGAELETERIPISQDAAALENALYDGEDFELLFTIPVGRQALFEEAWKKAFPLSCARIGKISAGSNILLRDAQGHPLPLARDGFEHFVDRKDGESS
jgi:thiamine-monophosphate kinase